MGKTRETIRPLQTELLVRRNFIFFLIFFSQVESEIQVESSLYFGSVIQVESSLYFGSVIKSRVAYILVV